MLRLIQRWPAWRGRPPDAAPAGRSVSGSLQALASRTAGARGASTACLRGLAATGLVLLAALAGLAVPVAAQTTTTEVEIWSAMGMVAGGSSIDLSTLSSDHFRYGGNSYEIAAVGLVSVFWTPSESLGSGTGSFILYVNGQANSFPRSETATGNIFNSTGWTGFNAVAGSRLSFRLVEVIENTSANLSALSLRDPDGGAVALSPAFSASTTSYTAVIPYKASTGPYYATLWATGKSLSITPADANASAPGHQVQLSPGKPKTVTVAVTAGDGTTMKSYTVAVTRPATDVCERTPAVRDAIVAAVSGVTHCGRVTPAHLAGIRPQYGLSITSPGFKLGDFAGLSGLRLLFLTPTDSTTVPAGLFDGATALVELAIGNSTSLTSLPGGLFRGLSQLRILGILSNPNLAGVPVDLLDGLPGLDYFSLSSNAAGLSLPSGLFRNVSSLTSLELYEAKLTALPPGIFAGLTKLRNLDLRFNRLGSLPTGIFNPLEMLEHLKLDSSGLSPAGVPDRIFEPLTRLKDLWLHSSVTTTLSGLRPVAEAGADLRVAPGAAVTLSGAPGASPWGSNVTYAWTQVDASDTPVSPATVTLADADTRAPRFTAPAAAGPLHFRLSVTGRGRATPPVGIILDSAVAGVGRPFFGVDFSPPARPEAVGAKVDDPAGGHGGTSSALPPESDASDPRRSTAPHFAPGSGRSR